jgi:acetyl-CoA C-acetyltransferase
MTAHIIAACRSPVVPRGGAFANHEIHDIAAPIVQAVLHRADLDLEQVDELIVSNALGAGGNPARRVALAAGLPLQVAGLSIDRQCAGGMDAILLAKAMVESGMAQVVIAGGVESYSRKPQRARTFADGRPPEPYEQAPFTPWPECDPDMTQAAADLGRRLRISRAEQDDWAVLSHSKARLHVEQAGEIVAIAGQETDPFTRRLSARLCARAKPLAGDITVANAAVAADAAAFCVVVAPHLVKDRQSINILGGVTRGDTPDCPGLAPVAAIDAALAAQKRRAHDLNCIEIMEAYAVQAIACVQGAGLDADRVNLGGGALARGHPIGASGAINTVRLCHSLWQTGGTGLAAIAAAGGIGTALVLHAD